MRSDERRIFEELTNDPATMDTVCAHIAEGGSLKKLCKVWQVPYGKVCNWIGKDATRAARFDDANKYAVRYIVEDVTDSLRVIASTDIRQIFSADGSISSPSDWPEGIALAISSIEVNELYDGFGRDKKQIGFTKKVKFWDKTKALELLGKDKSMFIHKTEHTVKLSLEDLVKGSFEKPVNAIDAQPPLALSPPVVVDEPKTVAVIETDAEAPI